MIGGMISSTILTLVVIPAVYSLWKERELAAAVRRARAVVAPPVDARALETPLECQPTADKLS